MTAKGSGSGYRVCEVCSTDYHASYTGQRACRTGQSWRSCVLSSAECASASYPAVA